MSVTTRLFDRGRDAWVQATPHGVTAASLICERLAHPKAKHALGGAVFGREALLVTRELFELVSERLVKPPPAPSSELVRLHALRELLTDITLPHELTDLRARGADVLLAWIDRIEERADRDHREHATTAVECGVEQLREALGERGLLSPGAWRAQLARRAKELRLPLPLIVLPQDVSDPAVSGLLKGLGTQQSIEVIGLSPASGVAAWCETARLGPDWGTDPSTHVGSRTDAIGAFGSLHRGEGGIELVAAGDELDASLGVIEAWLAAGVPASDIALVAPNAGAALSGIEESTQRREVPIMGLVRADASGSPLGAAAAAVITDPDDPAARERADVAGASPRLLGALCAAADGPERVRALAGLLQDAAMRSNAGALAARDLHFAEALVAAAVEASELEPRPSAHEIVTSTRDRPRVFGDPDGVAVVGYPQAGGLGRSHLVLTGLAADSWPPRFHPTAFASPDLVANAPGLGPRDLQSEFAACLCAADHAVLVREARDGFGRERAPSVFWVAAEAAGATQRPSPEARHTRPPRKAPSEGMRRSEQARIAVAERRRFSVEEIGSYLRCPRGWFAEYVLPRPPADPEASKGEASHAALAAAFHPGLADDIGVELRSEIAYVVLVERERAGEISAADIPLLHGRCRAVIDRYSPPTWPFRTVAVERHCALPTKDKTALVTGRIDRVDQNEHGAIVIDYKLNREPRTQNFGALVRNPQATLYSLMVDRRLSLNPLGVLFVSLSHAEHDGLVSADHPSWGPFARRESDLLWKKGTAHVMEAIEGMRAGRIERSPYCRRDCPCRRLSWDQA